MVDARGTVYEWGAHVSGGLVATTVTGQDVVQVVCGKDSTFALDAHVRKGGRDLDLAPGLH